MKTKSCDLRLRIVHYFFILLVLQTLNISGQNTLSSGGALVQSDYNSLSFTVGQTMYVPIISADGSVSFGIQNDFEVIDLTNIDKNETAIQMITLLPNPTSDYVILRIDPALLNQLGKYHYAFFDLSGKTIMNETISNIQTQINLKRLIPSIYLLRVFNDNLKVQTYKIIKRK